MKEDDLDDIPPAQRKARMSRKKNVYEKVVELGILDESRLAYMACITYADAMIGRVLDALDRSPYRDNTVIVLWSDNGYHLGEKGQWGKHTLWQRTTNVPMLWAGPGLAKGATLEASAMLLDIYPTLVELCGLKPDRELEGRSLAAALRNPAAAKDRHVFTIAAPNEYSVVNTQWRYIHYADGAEELYDEKSDSPEWTNLAANPEYRSLMDQMKAAAPAHFAAAGKKRGKMTLLTAAIRSSRSSSFLGARMGRGYSAPGSRCEGNPAFPAQAPVIATVLLDRGSPAKTPGSPASRVRSWCERRRNL